MNGCNCTLPIFNTSACCNCVNHNNYGLDYGKKELNRIRLKIRGMTVEAYNNLYKQCLEDDEVVK